MAYTMTNTSSSNVRDERQSNRLQRRLPSLKIEITSVTTWNVAIPLLSPLASSPKSSLDQSDVSPSHNQAEKPAEEVKKTPVFKKWQHPASPFCYDQTTFVQPFISV
ncbi:unnamed protein product [Eruca vesicaria subsp. sativa]|uniref:Uncharacterized protein n=1 Tax=Eruca vesicaria subsp. sativa TaxID=29727 RepID=A0ABC8LNR1_ERUVS|nr:unnamed protein product [Eruca vesicaria subsp. sativa]